MCVRTDTLVKSAESLKAADWVNSWNIRRSFFFYREEEILESEGVHVGVCGEFFFLMKTFERSFACK